MNKTTIVWLAAAALVPLAALAQTEGDPKPGQGKGEQRQELEFNLQSPGDGTVRILSSRNGQPTVLGLGGWGALDDKRISVELSAVPVRDALKRVFDAAKLDYVVDGELPGDATISLTAKNVSFTTVLDLVTQSAGVGWQREVRNGKTVYRVGKGLSTRFAPWRGAISSAVIQDPKAIQDRVYEMLRSTNNGLDKAPLVYSLTTREHRSTFTCPHCKGQVTVLREEQQPKCPKCGRMFQSDWQFCPNDGAKRPPSPGAWKYCPLCGKQVEPQ